MDLYSPAMSSSVKWGQTQEIWRKIIQSKVDDACIAFCQAMIHYLHAKTLMTCVMVCLNGFKSHAVLSDKIWTFTPVAILDANILFLV